MIYNQELTGYKSLRFESSKEECISFFETLGASLKDKSDDGESLYFKNVKYSNQAVEEVFCIFLENKLWRIGFRIAPPNKDILKVYDNLKESIDKEFYPSDSVYNFRDSFLKKIGLPILGIKYGGDSQSAFWEFDHSPFKNNTISIELKDEPIITIVYTHGGLEGLYHRDKSQKS